MIDMRALKAQRAILDPLVEFEPSLPSTLHALTRVIPLPFAITAVVRRVLRVVFDLAGPRDVLGRRDLLVTTTAVEWQGGVEVGLGVGRREELDELGVDFEEIRRADRF